MVTRSGDQPAGPALVGRDRELAALRAALDAALAGRGSLVLIGGEAGIGKTALAEWLLTEAEQQNALTLVGRCYDLSETPPYGPWTDLFARRSDEEPPVGAPLAGAAGDGTSQTALFERVRAYFADLAARQPLALLLDDLHWADPASLDLLRFLARRLAALPVLIIATYRAEQLTRHHPLFPLLPLLVRETGAARVDLRALDDNAVRAWLRARYRLAEPDETRLLTYLQARAEGNPFFTKEVLRTIEESRLLRATGAGEWTLGDLAGERVPPLLRQVLEGRLGRLGEAAREPLTAAAVIGQEVPLALWAAVAGMVEEALLDVVERAVEAHLLTAAEDGTGVRFAHALIREALYEGLLPPRRRLWHRRVGEALLATPGPDPDAVAFHLQRGGHPRAADWLVRAGERAQRAYAWLTAADRYEAALALMGEGAGAARERTELLIVLAQLRRYDAPERSVAHLDAAIDLAARAGDPVLVAAAQFDRGQLHCLDRDRPGGLAEMAAALPTLDDLPPDERRRLPTLALLGAAPEEHYHRGALAVQLARVGRLSEAWTLAAGMAARGSGTTARGLAALGLIHAYRSQPVEARRALSDARAIYQTRGHHLEAAITLEWEGQLVVTPYLADRPSEWQRLSSAFSAAMQLSGEVEQDRRWAGFTSQQRLWLEGRWADLRAEIEARDDYRFRGHLGRAQGAPVEGWAVVRRVFPDGPGTEPGGRDFISGLDVHQLAALLALDAGDLTTARAWLAAHDRWLAWSGAVLGQAEGSLGWAAYHRVAGDIALAHEHAARALAHASEPRQPLALLAAHRLIGELATAEGQYAEAADHLSAALALADACAAPYERALTLLALAELCVATGSAEPIHALLDEARAICIVLNARPALTRAESLAARRVQSTLHSVAAEVTPLVVGGMLGPYRLLERLGSGTLADAYRARHTILEREAAIKILRADVLHDTASLRRFAHEASCVAALAHPNIAAVWEYGELDGRPYVVLPFIRGITLAKRLATGSLPHAEALDYLQQLASALDYAHERGVIHGAVRPTNILLDEGGQVRLIDFELGRAPGTFAEYRPPEQTGRPDPGIDLHALGLVCLAMLMGTSVTLDTDARAPHERFLQALPPELAGGEAILRRALAEHPTRRYRSGSAFVAALAAALEETPPGIPPVAPAPARLTAREAAVLRLVARGLTNAQVAERLFVTPRTINAHLTNIYTKLNVDGRAAAIRVALDHDLR